MFRHGILDTHFVKGANVSSEDTLVYCAHFAYSGLPNILCNFRRGAVSAGKSGNKTGRNPKSKMKCQYEIRKHQLEEYGK